MIMGEPWKQGFAVGGRSGIGIMVVCILTIVLVLYQQSPSKRTSHLFKDVSALSPFGSNTSPLLGDYDLKFTKY